MELFTHCPHAHINSAFNNLTTPYFIYVVSIFTVLSEACHISLLRNFYPINLAIYNYITTTTIVAVSARRSIPRVYISY